MNKVPNNKANMLAPSLEVVVVDLPKQKNCHDCGVYVLKYLEMWDGQAKWGQKSMPDYSLEDILRIRSDIVCRLVLHEENKLRSFVLDNAMLPADLLID
ncbi:ubiquitin-like-specific protease ESD4 [Medicago truncatula]|nr:ubiquitin-like-specific protease ESD4 [Medicago truncatula]